MSEEIGIDLGKFRLIKYDIKTGILTTAREHGRHEDFIPRDDDPRTFDAAKHFGDHEWDSIGTIEGDNILDAAWKFHKNP